MLSLAHQATVKATLPVLQTGAEALITHFYTRLLSDHPALRPLFNPTHQASGNQPRALANAVLMYARHIDQLEALGPLVTRVVNKHVALQVQAEHYPLVGQCLLAAIAEVLGEAVATPAVLEAWAAAYGQLADILATAEAARYQQNAALPGGWHGARRFVVQRREVESPSVVSFYLQPDDNRPALCGEPGQYIGVRLYIEGQEHRRNYSLSQRSDGQGYRISVKAVPGGVVSGHLHAHCQAGAQLELFAPAGGFVLAEGDAPVLLLAAGIGITPLLPLVQAALEAGRDCTLLHCVRSAQDAVFAAHLQGLAARYPRFSLAVHCSEQAGRLSSQALAQWASPACQAYVVGPVPFMASQRAGLLALGVPAEHIHHEFFGPAQVLTPL